jgi:dTDP-4-amino-4,6-dideoxygalactose transaminase
VDKYTWIDNGSSWILSDLLAAVLLAQLERFMEIQQSRMRIWSTYERELLGWSTSNGVRTPFVPQEAEHPAHMFYLLMPNAESRAAFIDHLRDHGVMSVFHYLPLEETPYGRQVATSRQQPCSVSAIVSDTLVRLPLFPSLNENDLDRVITAVTSFKA